MISALHDQRYRAAVASRGTSSDAIHQSVLSEVHGLGPLGEVLEFGAGTAELARHLAAMDLAAGITCADILSRSSGLPSAIKWIQADLNGGLDVAAESFDTIIATEVIEHLENPRAVFREFHRLLRSSGRLILTTPNQESLRSLTALWVGGHFVHFLDASYPAHITALLRKDFDRISREVGFARPRFFYTNCGGIPKFPRLHWQRISFGLLRGRWFSDNVGLVTVKHPGRAGE